MLNPRYLTFIGLSLCSLLAGCDWLTGVDVSNQPRANEFEIAWEEDDNPGALEITPFPLASARDAPISFPANRSGHRRLDDPYFIVGETFPQWRLAEWAGSEPLTLESLRGRVVVVQFWTDDSQRSVQAMQKLAEEFRMSKVTFVGVYFSAGRLLETEWEHVLAKARDWEIDFPLAYDRQWVTLTRWWLARYDNLPLTPTFVLGPEGKVIHLHPGPAFYPSDEPSEKLANDDFTAMRAAIRQGLSGKIAQVTSDGPVESQP